VLKSTKADWKGRRQDSRRDEVENHWDDDDPCGEADPSLRGQLDLAPIAGIYIADEFRLLEHAQVKTRLTIGSTISPKGMKVGLMHGLMGRQLKNTMMAEWESASKALLEEMAARRSVPT